MTDGSIVRLFDRSTWRKSTVLLMLMISAGCGFLRPQQKNYFALETLPPEAAPVAMAGLPLGVDVVELPPGIDRREIVVRQENGELELRGRDLWSANLEAMVIHTLAFDLAKRVPEGMVVLPGAAKPAGAMRSINVVMEKFEAGPGSMLTLDGRWILRTPGGADTIHHETIEVPLTSLDSAQIAQGMSRALATLADRIVSR